jgi:hypothetical protein
MPIRCFLSVLQVLLSTSHVFSMRALQLTRHSLLQSSLVALAPGVGGRRRGVPAGRQLSARSVSALLAYALVPRSRAS